MDCESSSQLLGGYQFHTINNSSQPSGCYVSEQNVIYNYYQAPNNTIEREIATNHSDVLRLCNSYVFSFDSQDRTITPDSNGLAKVRYVIPGTKEMYEATNRDSPGRGDVPEPVWNFHWSIAGTLTTVGLKSRKRIVGHANDPPWFKPYIPTRNPVTCNAISSNERTYDQWCHPGDWIQCERGTALSPASVDKDNQFKATEIVQYAEDPYTVTVNMITSSQDQAHQAPLGWNYTEQYAEAAARLILNAPNIVSTPWNSLSPILIHELNDTAFYVFREKRGGRTINVTLAYRKASSIPDKVRFVSRNVNCHNESTTGNQSATGNENEMCSCCSSDSGVHAWYTMMTSHHLRVR